MLLDPVLGALAGLKSLDDLAATVGVGAPHSERGAHHGILVNLVGSHRFIPPSLDGLIIADLSGSVNRFFEKKLKKFFNRPELVISNWPGKTGRPEFDFL